MKRVEKLVHLEDKVVNGKTVRFFACGGVVGIAQLGLIARRTCGRSRRTTLTSPIFISGATTSSRSTGHFDDSMWLGRAHSKGAARQTVNLLGYVLMVNGLAIRLHRKRQAAAPSGEFAA